MKFILYWHLDITKQKLLGKIFHPQTIKLLERADQIVATSPNYIEGSYYLSKYRKKCVVIPNCIREERLSVTEKSINKAEEIRKYFSGKTICLSIGRHVPYKGISYLIHASKQLDNSFIILIGGNGPLTKSLKTQAKDDSKIVFLGRVSDEDLVAYLLACDIFTFPSITKNEAFGIALAEAMFFQKPTITFKIPGSGVNFVSLHGKTGIECPNKDINSFAEAIKYLQINNLTRKIYGENAQKRVIDLFSIKQFKDAIQKII